MSIENPFEYSPLGKKPGEAGIAFSKIESNYNDQSFRMDFEAYASAHYKTRKPDRTYLLDKQQCDSFKENTFQDKHQNDFIKKFSSKDMALKIKFFGILKEYLEDTDIIIQKNETLLNIKKHIIENNLKNNTDHLKEIIEKSIFSNNKKFLKDKQLIKKSSTIYLLPPFSGG